jgi:hypothetical protein
MQGYGKGGVGTFTPVRLNGINGILVAFMQGCSKGSAGPFLPIHYKGFVEVSMQGILRALWGP